MSRKHHKIFWEFFGVGEMWEWVKLNKICFYYRIHKLTYIDFSISRNRKYIDFGK